MKNIAIIGCGAIGSQIAQAIDSGIIKHANLFSLYDISFNKILSIKNILKHSNPIFAKNLETALINSNIIVESASQEAVNNLILSKHTTGKILLVLSTGAFLTNSGLMKKAQKSGIIVYFPSGAIAGIDAVKAAALGHIKIINLVTRKPPNSLGINEKLSKPKLLFSGLAQKAVKLFPANINVAATLAISGISAKKTFVTIIADPALKYNTHEIEVKGDFGNIMTRTENHPSKLNPKTSYLAILSAISELKNICEH